jgi:hypothetical protein
MLQSLRIRPRHDEFWPTALLDVVKLVNLYKAKGTDYDNIGLYCHGREGMSWRDVKR